LIAVTNPMLFGLEILFLDDEEDGGHVYSTPTNKDAEKQTMTNDNNSKERMHPVERKERIPHPMP
jgi:hypothetical protein